MPKTRYIYCLSDIFIDRLEPKKILSTLSVPEYSHLCTLFGDAHAMMDYLNSLKHGVVYHVCCYGYAIGNSLHWVCSIARAKTTLE